MKTTTVRDWDDGTQTVSKAEIYILQFVRERQIFYGQHYQVSLII